jgi:hypothetical protein
LEEESSELLLSLSDNSSGRSSSSLKGAAFEGVAALVVLVYGSAGTSSSLSLKSEDEDPVESHPTRSGMSSESDIACGFNFGG